MKHTSELSQKIMRQVIEVEQRDTQVFQRTFRVFVMLLALIFCTVAIILYNAAVTNETFELLELFTQDWEIISLYWRDSLQTIVAELNPDMIRSAIFCAIVFCIGLYLTGKSRARIKNVEKEVEKLKKTHKE